MKTIRFIYSALLGFSLPFFLPKLLKKKDNKPSVGNRWIEYFGFTPKTKMSNPIWIHAVSVGEVIAVTPFIKAIKSKKPSINIILTTTTTTGFKQAESIGDLVEHRFMPFDFTCCISKFIETIKPEKLIIVETELWPNTIFTVSRYNIPIYVLNARLSSKSLNKYLRFRWFISSMLNEIELFLCQYNDDADNFIKLGVMQDKVTCIGTMKFDIFVERATLIRGNELREILGERPIWIAASTHAGEEEMLLDIHKKIIEKKTNTLLFLVPRHPERFDLVYSIAKEKGFSLARRSSLSNELLSEEVNVLIGDSMGELLTFIQASDICFMGGSFAGSKVGGHNVIEPAALGKPTIIGPSYYNFSEVVSILNKANAISICDTQDELYETLLSTFTDKTKSIEMSKNSSSTVARNQGSIDKALVNIGLK